jgi:hypothetical protein
VCVVLLLLALGTYSCTGGRSAGRLSFANGWLAGWLVGWGELGTRVMADGVLVAGGWLVVGACAPGALHAEGVQGGELQARGAASKGVCGGR